MSRFNANKKPDQPDTVNVAGGNAFLESPKLEFISILLTSFLNDKYYESKDENIRRIINLIDNIPDKKFIAKAAIYARTKFGMRSVSHLVAGEIAKNIKGEEWTKNFFDKIVYRPDDMLEIIAYHMKNYGDRPIPNSLKKGFRKAIGKFNSYELGKYKCENKEVSMIDLVNLIHPTPTEKNGFAIGDLINGTLKAKESSGGEHYAQNDPHLRKIEYEAFLLGNIIFRDFQDELRYGPPKIKPSLPRII